VPDKDKEVQNHSLIVYLKDLGDVLDAGLGRNLRAVVQGGNHD
jgi:hypothetical protein